MKLRTLFLALAVFVVLYSTLLLVAVLTIGSLGAPEMFVILLVALVVTARTTVIVSRRCSKEVSNNT